MSTPRRRKEQEPLSEIATLATVPTATDHPSPVAHLTQPTHDDIARRAYQLYEQRGGEHGHDWDDWFQAERELRQLSVQAVVDRSVATERPYVAA